MPFCENCGSRVSDNANFCSNCGAKIVTYNTQAISQKTIERSDFKADKSAPDVNPNKEIIPLNSIDKQSSSDSDAKSSDLNIYSTFITQSLTKNFGPLRSRYNLFFDDNLPWTRYGVFIKDFKKLNVEHVNFEKYKPILFFELKNSSGKPDVISGFALGAFNQEIILITKYYEFTRIVNFSEIKALIKVKDYILKTESNDGRLVQIEAGFLFHKNERLLDALISFHNDYATIKSTEIDPNITLNTESTQGHSEEKFSINTSKQTIKEQDVINTANIINTASHAKIQNLIGTNINSKSASGNETQSPIPTIEHKDDGGIRNDQDVPNNKINQGSISPIKPKDGAGIR